MRLRGLSSLQGREIVANPNKAKGSRFELEVERYLQDKGIYAFRPRQTGHVDVGDVHAPPVCIQAKAYRDMASALRDGTEGAARQRVAAGLPFGVAVVKRPGKNVAESYAVMRLSDLPDVIRALQASE